MFITQHITKNWAKGSKTDKTDENCEDKETYYEDRKRQGEKFKERGNDFFKGKEYERAEICYTNAILQEGLSFKEGFLLRLSFETSLI